MVSRNISVYTILFKTANQAVLLIVYEFRPSLATPILLLVDVRRDVPFFYDTFLV